jgi:hypothetical protein
MSLTLSILIEKETDEVFEEYCLCSFVVIEVSALLSHQDA